MRKLVLCCTRGEAQGWGHSHNTFWNAPTLGLCIVGMSPAWAFALHKQLLQLQFLNTLLLHHIIKKISESAQKIQLKYLVSWLQCNLLKSLGNVQMMMLRRRYAQVSNDQDCGVPLYYCSRYQFSLLFFQKQAHVAFLPRSLVKQTKQTNHSHSLLSYISRP